jgi:hypothetical protein
MISAGCQSECLLSMFLPVNASFTGLLDGIYNIAISQKIPISGVKNQICVNPHKVSENQ